MASGTSLKLKFDTMSGSKTWTFANAKASTTTQAVKTLGATMIANASLFEFQPVTLREARLVTTTEDAFDLDA